MSEINSFEGFQRFSTFKSTLSDHAITALGNIIEAFYQSPKYQAMCAFYDDLNSHIRDYDPHALQLSTFSSLLISDLYVEYRKLVGYGSKKQMLFAIMKDIVVGTLDDGKVGLSVDKATTAPIWKYLMDTHEETEGVHDCVFSQITPCVTPYMPPSFLFSSEFPEDYSIYEEDGYTIPTWYTHKGTIACECSYDLSDSLYEITKLPIFSLYGVSEELSVYYQHGSDGKTRLVVDWVTSDDTTNLFTNALPMASNSLDRMVMSFNSSSISIRDLTHSATVDNPMVSEYTTLCLFQPLEYGNGIKEISHYPVEISKAEQSFFLL